MKEKLFDFCGLIWVEFKINYILIVLLTCSNILGQEKLKDNDTTFYRKDKIYFGSSFILLNSEQEKFKRQGISKHFQLGFVRDIPIISSGKLAIGLGLGYSFQDYNSNLVRFNINNGSSIYIVNYTLNQKSKLSFNFSCPNEISGSNIKKMSSFFIF